MSTAAGTHTGTAVPLRVSDVDTDQIIPARFVPYFTRGGLTNALFGDWRDDPSFPLNRAEHQGATVLVAGDEFGTGSSREAAVWALQAAGFRAVVAAGFGDIFAGNAGMRGLITAAVPRAAVEELWRRVEADPFTTVTVDVGARRVRHEGGDVACRIDPGVRERLLSGADPVATTLRRADAVDAFERTRRAAMPTTRTPEGTR